MKKLPILLSLTLAFSGANAAYPASATLDASRQTRAEVDDIGSISESETVPDGKSAPAPTPKPSPWRFNFGARADYTSNAFLSGHHSSGDFIFFPNLEAGYHAPLGHGFAFDALGRIESGIYADHNDRTFIGYSVTNTLEWRPRPNLPRIYIGVEPYRYDRFDGQGRITEAIGTSVGTDWGYGFNNGNSLLSVGYSYTDYFSDPQVDSRFSHAAILCYSQVLSQKLTLQAFYQYVHEFYPSFHDRQDSRNVVGVNFIYQISRRLFTTVGASFVDNDSNRALSAYQSAGFNLGLNYQF